MKIKAFKFSVIFILFFVIYSIFLPSSEVYAYADLSEFNNYIENLEISYKDLNLTPEELAVIEELQQKGGITYGMYTDDNTVLMIFNQIAKVFEIEVHQVEYDDFTKLTEDIADGEIDFSGSVYHTPERNEIFDFTMATHRDKTFLYTKHDVFEKIRTDEPDSTSIIKIGYPQGFALDAFISDEFKENFDYEMIALQSVDDAVDALKVNELDMVLGDISWYEKIIAIKGIMAIDYTDYIDTVYAANVTKKGTNKELVSAINKMYSETDALIELQNQIDNYYENAAMHGLTQIYKEEIDTDKINQIYVTEYRPYVYQENGEPTGLLVELLKKISDSFGMKYEITFVDDNKADYLSESDITVTMPVFVTNENKERYYLTIPVSESNMQIITIPDKNTKYFTKVSDLGVQKIGALNYGYMHDYMDVVFSNSENVYYYDNLESLISAMEAGEVKFGLISYEEFNKYAIDKRISDIITLSTIKLPQFEISYGTPKTTLGANTEAVLSSALSIANYSDLINKYLSTNSELEAVYEYRTETLRSVIHMTFFTSLFVIFTLCTLIYINTKRANNDYLTKLRNRRTLESYIKVVKSKKNMSIAYIDLDNFKVINDVYGHDYGDKVLIYVAESLKKLSYSRTFRIGGDEFIIVYNNKFVDFENDIKKVLGVNIAIEQTDIKVEGSIGNLKLEKYCDFSVEDIINLVDYAMISAKRRGKNLIVEIDDDLVNSYIAIRDLRLALEEEQYEDTLKLYLESIKEDNKTYGFCLIAKCHNNGKYVDYNEIQIHMTNKLILNKIGLLIFEKLCKSINRINNNNSTKMRYIYDLSTETLTEKNIQILLDILTKYEINPTDITLRVDPTLFVGSRGKQYVKLLNTLGCNTIVNFHKVTGDSLLCLNQIDISLLELNLTTISEFLTDNEHIVIEDLPKSLSTNLALSKLIDLAEVFKTDLLLYTSGKKYENLIIEFLANSINKKIYIVEKDSLIPFEEYLNNID